ncbi:hypothetical protein RRG08_040224 [Elysia crispata]|uniref:Uncharacterized protein n=1 Tax=Elysia crispata TaxID=231223 RepID=A0AAE0ZY75_9GAST|nr:hypothetical protein RRG08_040224 [Elysia crispata]
MWPETSNSLKEITALVDVRSDLLAAMWISNWNSSVASQINLTTKTTYKAKRQKLRLHQPFQGYVSQAHPREEKLLLTKWKRLFSLSRQLTIIYKLGCGSVLFDTPDRSESGSKICKVLAYELLYLQLWLLSQNIFINALPNEVICFYRDRESYFLAF